jgi:hypothetical protein
MAPPRDYLLGERDYSDLVAYVRLNGEPAEVVRTVALACGASHPDIIRRALQFWIDQGCPKISA